MEFCNYVERFKWEIGLSDDDLAKIMKVGDVTYKNLMSGYAKPTKAMVKRLVKILAMSPPSYAELPFDTIETAQLRDMLYDRSRFCTRVANNDMAGAGIYKGSGAIVQTGIRPSNGDILYVLIDGKKSGLMHYEHSDRGYRLFNDKAEFLISPTDFKKRVRVAGKLVYTVDKVSRRKSAKA